MDTAALASKGNISIFGILPFSGLLKRLGQRFKSKEDAKNSCDGHLDIAMHVNSTDYLKLEGWIFDRVSQPRPSLLSFYDSAGRIVGFGMVGRSRPDVARVMGDRASSSGFKGYVSVESQGKTLSIASADLNCILTTSVPALP